MRRFRIGFFVVLLLASGAAFAGQTVQVADCPNGVTLLNEDSNGLTLETKLGEISFANVATKGGTFNLLTVPGLTRSQHIGEPNLPSFRRLIAIPEGCELKVEAVSSGVKTIALADYGLAEVLMPTQPSLCKSDDPATVPFEFDQALYEKAGYYSLPTAQTEILGFMRDVRLALVTVSPFEYNPTEHELRIHTDITVTVTFDHPDWAKTETNRLRGYSPYFTPVLDQVMNYRPPTAGTRDDLTRDPVKYVIVSDPMFEAQLQSFIEWKTQRGFEVITAYTDEIGTSNTQIRNYLDSLWEARTSENPAPSFVLLVGDAQQIPPFNGQAGSHVTDLPFCEFTSDDFPEIYYGRFSAQNTDDLQPQIDKTIEYEQYLMPDPSYLERVALVSGVDASNASTYGNGQINYGTSLYFNAAHGIDPSVWLYPASSGGTAAADIRATVSEGVALYNYTAHCGHTGHSNPSFTTSHIPSLENYHMYVLGIGNCCTPNTFGTSYSTPCFGEAFLQAVDKGGIGYIGSTDNTLWDEDYWWGVGSGPVVGGGADYSETGLGAYDGVFHDHGEPKQYHYVANDAIVFAGCMAVSEAGSSNDSYYWEAYMLMGDPSLMTYLGVPSANDVSHDASILLTAEEFEVEAEPGSYVGITFDGELQGGAFVDSSGSVEVPLVGFSVPGEAKIVVCCQNRIPYMANVPVVAPVGPYVVYDSSSIDDTAGNGNGLVDVGESMFVGVRLKNVGPEDGLNINATLSSADPYVTMLDSVESYGTVPGDFGLIYIADAFEIEIDPAAPDGHEVVFNLEITGSARETWTGDFEMTIHSPALAYSYMLINDASGNGNGVVDPGESAELVMTLRNGGTGQAYAVEAYLVQSDPYITLTDDYGAFGLIDSIDGSADNSGDVFTLTADGECPVGYVVPMQLQVTTQEGYAVTLDCQIVVGDRAIVYFDDFSTDQGWGILGGSAEWEIGPLMGLGGDPAEDYSSSSDNGVLGNDLSGNGTYENNIAETQWVTSPVIDCDNLSGVMMSFYRWLGVERSLSDLAALEVFDGTDWVRLYENSSGTSVRDNDWVRQEYDLSLMADYNPVFQVRFGLGPTSMATAYCGWNIDDLEIKGYGNPGHPDMQLAASELIDSVQPGTQELSAILVRNDGEGTLSVRFSTNNDWLQLSTAPQVVYQHDSLDFEITIDATSLSCGDHNGAISWVSNDSKAASGIIPVSVHVYAPEVYVIESAIDEIVQVGEQASHPYVISNNGPGRLDYEVGCRMFTELKDGSKYGGPDSFGHFWISSDDPGGPSCDWIDISGVGTQVMLGDDEVAGPFAIGFDFPFYGNTCNSLYFNSNGLITFDAGVGSGDNIALPSQSLGTGAIAAWWDNLDPSQGGCAYYYHDVSNGRFIVSYVGVPVAMHPEAAGSLSFQVVLYEDGVILLQYEVMYSGTATLRNGTVALQNTAGTDGLLIAYNEPFMHSQLAVLISSAHWLSSEPASGSVEPFADATVEIKFNATDIERGNYTGAVVISSNDPNQPILETSVSMIAANGCCIGTTGNVDCDLAQSVDMGDLTVLIDHLFISLGPLCCEAEGNIDNEGEVDMGDLTTLIDHLFISLAPLPLCP